MDSKYNLTYPHYLPWSRRIWVTQEGEEVVYEGKRYRVKQVLKSRMANAKPKLVLEPLDE